MPDRGGGPPWPASREPGVHPGPGGPLAGRRIRARGKVVVLHASAHRDEPAFTDPDGLHLDRSPHPHVSFGDGPRLCLGAHLARLQLRLLQRKVLRTLPEPRLAGAPVRLVSNFVHGIKSPPLHLA
ncbi:cytochrome P450 [Streptomyces sp. MUM 136J]|nr:cytochrome P450 [Streptomyces sp. MUM 136J]